MPDKREHRGPHPQDKELFAAEQVPCLQAAAAELCWLLSRGYAATASLKLIGDRHQLTARQRIAVARCSCSDQELASRQSRETRLAEVDGRTLWLDGYNVLTTVEAALADGVILLACDGCYRDLASMHGSYRKVAETLPALRLIGEYLKSHRIDRTVWFLDSPVSNSGRLKGLMQELFSAHGWNGSVELVSDPDPVLATTDELIATADSVILNRCRRWINLARGVVDAISPRPRIVDLSRPG